MSQSVVFLFQVDNTLLDDDRVAAGRTEHLEREVGHGCQERCWRAFEELRARVGYADYPGALPVDEGVARSVPGPDFTLEHIGGPVEVDFQAIIRGPQGPRGEP